MEQVLKTTWRKFIYNMKNLKFNVTILIIAIITLCELFVVGFIGTSLLLWIGYGVWRTLKDNLINFE